MAVKHKEFDILAAREGKKIEFMTSAGTVAVWIEVHFVGVDHVRGGIVVQKGDGQILTTQRAMLRMKAETIAPYLNFWAKGRCTWHESRDDALSDAQAHRLRNDTPIAIAIQVTVPLD